MVLALPVVTDATGTTAARVDRIIPSKPGSRCPQAKRRRKGDDLVHDRLRGAWAFHRVAKRHRGQVAAPQRSRAASSYSRARLEPWMPRSGSPNLRKPRMCPSTSTASCARPITRRDGRTCAKRSACPARSSRRPPRRRTRVCGDVGGRLEVGHSAVRTYALKTFACETVSTLVPANAGACRRSSAPAERPARDAVGQNQRNATCRATRSRSLSSPAERNARRWIGMGRRH
jgi:hypothetical protein